MYTILKENVCHGDLGNLEIIKIIAETIKDNKLT